MEPSQFGFPELITVHVDYFIGSHPNDPNFLVLVLVHGLSMILISLRDEVYLYFMLLLS